MGPQVAVGADDWGGAGGVGGPLLESTVRSKVAKDLTAAGLPGFDTVARGGGEANGKVGEGLTASAFGSARALGAGTDGGKAGTKVAMGVGVGSGLIWAGIG